MRSFLLSSTIVASVLLAAPAPAAACWDGFYVSTGRVVFTGEGDDAWSPVTVLELARWARRFEVLLGPTGSLEADMGYGDACIGARCVEVAVPSLDPGALFAAVGRELHIPWSRRAAALATDAAPFTVQVAASRDRAQAEALATRLSEGELPVGFVEIGGFPADNPEAHVLDGVDTAGLPVYRVVVGAFLDRDAARTHQAEIAAATGLPTLVRSL